MVPGLLVMPLLVFMLVFYVLPVLAMLLRSVAEPSWTLGNYTALVDDTVFLNVFWTTLRTAVTVTFGCVLLGYPVALTLVRPGADGGGGADRRFAAVLDFHSGPQLCLDGAAGAAAGC